ncbi:hypothetical protein TNCV_4517551 [Trichonephila clavipes]|nr:hypothetical protein TNCV_4517551 [Trichonephila clavipes]
MMRPTYKVRYTEWPPWAMDTFVENITVLDGVLKDVYAALSYSLNYNFDIKSQEDHQFGSLQGDGSYSGMLGKLINKSLDKSAGAEIRNPRPEEVQSNALPTRLSGLVANYACGIAPSKEDSAPRHFVQGSLFWNE